MGLWNSNKSIDREKDALDNKHREIQRQIEELQKKVQNLSQNKATESNPVIEDEILPLEGHHSYQPRKKDHKPSLRSHQNRDRNLFFLFMGLFVFLIFMIFRYWKPS